MTQNLIDYISFAYLVIQKAVMSVLIRLAAEVIAMKTVSVESLVLRVVDINENDIYSKMALLRQGTMVVL